MNFVCPRCHGHLDVISDTELSCPRDNLIFRQKDGVWRFLLPERESHFASFISDYEAVRHFEQRGSSNSSFYRSLPFYDTSGKFPKDWKIRAKSYLALEKVIKSIGKTNHILDLGAGNGWLSNRLTLQGYQVSAVDLITNPQDGLGARHQYESRFECVHSEFDCLPFPNAYVSVIIFNASFHYSENYEKTLAESLRVLEPQGRIIIMDSPVYRDPSSGSLMIAERKKEFISRHGIASDSIKSQGFLTYEQMDDLGNKSGVNWSYINVFYGINWLLRPLLSRLRGKREPAKFGLWVGSFELFDD